MPGSTDIALITTMTGPTDGPIHALTKTRLDAAADDIPSHDLPALSLRASYTMPVCERFGSLALVRP